MDHFREGPECGVVKTLLQYIPGMAPKKTEYQYDLVSGNVNYVAYQAGTTEQLIHRYRYDEDNRIEQVLTSTDGHVWSTDAITIIRIACPAIAGDRWPG